MNIPRNNAFQPIAYSDWWIKALCIPVWAVFFRHIAEPAQLIDLLRSPQYYIDIVYILSASFVLWQLNVFLIQWLDRRYSWISQASQRFAIQAVLGYGITAFLISILAVLYYQVVLLHPQPVNISYLLLTEIPLSLMFVTIIHLLYTGLWMIAFHTGQVSALEKEIASYTLVDTPADEIYKQTLLVNHGKGMIPLPVEQIAYIFIANEVSIVKTLEGQSYSVDGTLEQLAEQLSSQDFFRISRQFIVRKKAIKKVDNETSGRLLLHLQPACTEEVTVSRRRAPDFRRWLEK